eukprot:6186666-Pleurochrysis_carterae.AAC.1
MLCISCSKPRHHPSARSATYLCYLPLLPTFATTFDSSAAAALTYLLRAEMHRSARSAAT